jgi:hypothetical protein
MFDCGVQHLGTLRGICLIDPESVWDYAPWEVTRSFVALHSFGLFNFLRVLAPMRNETPLPGAI